MTERVPEYHRYREADRAESPSRALSAKTTPEPRAMSATFSALRNPKLKIKVEPCPLAPLEYAPREFLF